MIEERERLRQRGGWLRKSDMRTMWFRFIAIILLSSVTTIQHASAACAITERCIAETTIPDCIGDDRTIRSIKCPHHSLYGSIPWRALEKLTSLEILDLGFNKLTGSVPATVLNSRLFENLKYFDLRGNYIIGDGNLYKESFSLRTEEETDQMSLHDENSLSIAGIAGGNGIQQSSIHENPHPFFVSKTTGTTCQFITSSPTVLPTPSPTAAPTVLPTPAPTTSMMPTTTFAPTGAYSGCYFGPVCGSASIYSTIPTCIGQATAATSISCTNYYLTGTIPTSISKLTRLKSLTLGNQCLTGSIPSGIGQLTKLTYLQLSSLTSLTGSIPTSIGLLTKLKYLNMYYLTELKGSLPTSIGSLGNLTYFSMYYMNSITGSIPTSMGLLSKLSYLSMSVMPQLKGSLPTSIGGLSSLTYMQISTTSIAGALPTSLGSLTALQTLNLATNCLNGTIPTTFANMSSLVYLYLQSNKLSGSLSSSMCTSIYSRLSKSSTPTIDLYANSKMTCYASICSELGTNFISGSMQSCVAYTGCYFGPGCGYATYLSTIPTCIGDSTAVTSISCSSYYLTGTIPTSISKLTRLKSLSLGYHSLTGSIPSGIGQLTALTYLQLLYMPRLTGSMPSWIGTLSNLQYLYFATMSLSGAIPTTIGGLSSLTSLQIHGCSSISGSIPASISGLSSLVLLQLSNLAKLTGSIPTGIGGLTSLTSLQISTTSIAGALPSSLGSLTRVTALYLQTNCLTGTIPSSLSGMSVLYGLYLQGNGLSGSMPSSFCTSMKNHYVYSTINIYGNSAMSCYGSTCASMTYFTKSSTAMKRCSLPTASPTISMSPTLTMAPTMYPTITVSPTSPSATYASYSYCYFGPTCGYPITGSTIPTCIGDLTAATSISCTGYALTGTFPLSISKLTALKSLTFGAFCLTGSIPSSIGQLTKLTLLEFFAMSSLTGSIPSSIGKLSKLEILTIFSMSLMTGSLPKSMGKLKSLVSLQIYSASLSGAIPSSLGSLHRLSTVYLQNNCLTGTIPTSLSNMSSLVNLNLEINKLTGSFPASLCTSMESRGTSSTININYNTYMSCYDLSCSSLPYFYSTLAGGCSPTAAPTATPAPSTSMMPTVSMAPTYPSSDGSSAYSGCYFGPVCGSTSFYSTIPTCIGQATAATSISCTYYYLTGTIPTSISKLTRLKSLTLGYHSLTGSIPSGIGQLTKLTYLQLFIMTSLTGSIPSSISKLSKLQYLSLSQLTNLKGSLPTSIGGLSSLTYMQMYYMNSITGSIPSSIGSLSKLSYLSMSLMSKLKGSLPTGIGGLTSLTSLQISTTSVAGALPSSLGSLTRVTALYLQTNCLTGTIPTNSIRNMSSLLYLYLQGNKLSGPLSSSLCSTLKTRSVYSQINVYGNSAMSCYGTKCASMIYFTKSSSMTKCSSPTASPTVTMMPTVTMAPTYKLGTSVPYANCYFGPQCGYATTYSTLPDCIGEATAATSISCTGYYLTGTIPGSISKLTRLQSFSMSYQCLTGSIPSGIGQLTRLTSLQLYYMSSLTGSIPSSISKLSKLQILSVYSLTSLTGTLPTIGNLTYLQVVSTGFGGSVPSSIGQMSKLKVLQLSSLTSLTGPLPSAIGDLSSLTSLQLYYLNSITGSIPSSIGKLSKLQYLSLFYTTKLKGLIPTSIGGLSSLTYMQMYFLSSITGSIPSSIGSLSKLSYLSMSAMSKLTGSLPTSIGGLTSLTSLQISTTSIAGALPSSLGSLTRVTALSLQTNCLTGTLPVNLRNMTSLYNLYLQNNKLSGPLLSSLCTVMMNRYVYSQINLNGNLAMSCYGSTCASLVYFTRGSTAMGLCTPTALPTASPSTAAPTASMMPTLSLAPTTTAPNISAACYLSPDCHAYRHSSIPTCIGHDTTITAISCSGYSLIGAIPTQIGKLTKLYSLDLSNNCLTGSLPSACIFMPHLLSLSLASNKLAGSLDELNSYYMTGLRTLSLALNSFSGTIPTSFSYLTGLYNLKLESNQLTGTIPSGISSLSYLNYLFLEGNSLRGTIPTSFGSMHNLYSINLQNNSLTGPIPSALASSSNLSSLNVASNKLTGTVPSSVCYAFYEHAPNASLLNIRGNSGITCYAVTCSSYLKTLETNLYFACGFSAKPSSQPSGQPSIQPSQQPTVQPSSRPSSQPTRQPSERPSSQPSLQPTSQPTKQPTSVPSSQPSLQPSSRPSRQPTSQPTSRPSAQPSVLPSSQPSLQPTNRPTTHPVSTPTSRPSTQPSQQPSSQPSTQPSTAPSSQPSTQPSSAPSTLPTQQPTTQPTDQPVSRPSSQPSTQPSSAPSTEPSRQPTARPSIQPSTQPSSQPTEQPSQRPSSQPTDQPTDQPTAEPSAQPSLQPSGRPSNQPTTLPTTIPSSQPSTQPSSVPSTQPSGRPSNQPTTLPTTIPSSQPSTQPSSVPSTQPSGRPSNQPTVQPTTMPSSQPSEQPTSVPSAQPSQQPTNQPTNQPTMRPSVLPSTQPSSTPSAQPTEQPSQRPTCQPTDQPTTQPTAVPSTQPSAQPTEQPSDQPTSRPSQQPSERPSQQPTSAPSGQPSEQPSSQPSVQPSQQPTNQPSSQPTSLPSMQPTQQPSSQPTAQPSRQPTSRPAGRPTGQPSVKPSQQPTEQPTSQPSSQPSMQPTRQPTSQPSARPTRQPTHQPTSVPSVQPSEQPSSQPTSQPSSQPTSLPSIQPTQQPTSQPTSQPSSQPSLQPTQQPSTQPSVQPSQQPTSRPSSQPTTAPSIQPSSVPSIQPSQLPTSQPSSEPSEQPSSQPTVRPTKVPTPAPTKLSKAPTASPTVSMAPTQSQAPTTLSDSKKGTHAPTSLPAAKTAPELESISVYPYSEALDVNATLKTPISDQRYSGTLYCAALTDGSVPTSVNAVKTSGFSTSYFKIANISTLSVTITGLAALTHYSVFCYSETSLGYGNSLADVISKGEAASTSCCKTMSFTNAPVYVFGDIAKYTSASPTTSYVFTYTLNSAPSGKVYVTPVISSSTTTSNVTAIPATTSFTSGSYDLQGSFILSAASLASSARFTVTLNVTGPSASEFSTLSTSVYLLYVYDALPAPALSSCRFSDNGASITISFSAATDVGGFADRKWACSEVFNFTGASSAICTWSSASVVVGEFSTSGNSDLIAVGDTVGILAGKLRAACTSSSSSNCTANYKNSAQSVVALAPYNPVVPTVVVISSTNLGPCDSLGIDPSSSSGNGGRAWSSIGWGIVADDSSGVAAIVSYLKKFTSIATPIVVPRSLLKQTTYYITLTLQNFLGQSSAKTVSVTVAGDRTLPSIAVIGSTSLVIKAMDALSIYAQGQTSACVSSSVVLVYTWSLHRQGVSTALSITSTSADPRKFSLSAFTLTAGYTYTATVSVVTRDTTTGEVSKAATAPVTIYVQHGSVVAIIQGGGYSRAMPVSQQLVISASPSYDEDHSTLYYSWACSIASETLFGSECGIYNTFGKSTVNVNGSSLTLPAFIMSRGTVYAYTVRVYTADGRSAYASLAVTPVSAGSASVTITSTKLKFNVDSTLSLTGYMSANFPVGAFWSVYFADSAVPISALTALNTNFTAAEAAIKITYPFSAGPYTFSAGCIYTFRLTVNALDGSSDPSYGEIVLSVNAVPRGGIVYSDPTRGFALSTSFKIYASGWIDDVSNYPLTYAFYYQQDSSYPLLSLAEYSQLTYTTSKLPSGLSSNRYALTLLTSVSDINSATASATGSVNVTTAASSSFNATSYLGSTLSKSLRTGDSNAAFQAINNVASTINIVSCTASPSCGSLNRAICTSVPNTCGSCLTGYTGIIGAANTRCFNTSAQSVGRTGDHCLTGSDCIYGQCMNGNCSAPLLSCPSQSLETVCSGRGSCVFEDSVGNTLASCTIFDTTCTASCSCDSGYGGSDCSLDAAALSAIDAVRTSMCGALITLSENQDPSTTLLDTLTTSLFATYSPSEVTSDSGTAECAKVLTIVTNMAANGYLKGAKQSTYNYLASSISSFASTSSSHTSSSSSAVSTAVTGFVSGVLQTMVAGQTPINLVSDNVRVQVRRDRLLTLHNASLTTPQTAAEAAYGVLQPVMSLGSSGLSSCKSLANKGYSQLSVMQWGKNPYANSTSLKSTLLRFSSSSGLPASSRRRVLKGEKTSYDYALSEQPSYFITLQFSQKQSFNFSAQLGASSSPSSTGSNWTLPECRFHNGIQYESCRDCNISSFTNDNVTYACFNGHQLCPGYTSSRRALREDALDGRRMLGADDDGAGDDDGGANEKTDVSVYGTLVMALVAELSSVLSGNPFAFDPSKAAGILAFTGTLVFLIIGGFAYFYSWDYDDRMEMIYLTGERKKKERADFARRARAGQLVTTEVDEGRSTWAAIQERIFPKRTSITADALPEVVHIAKMSDVGTFDDVILKSEKLYHLSARSLKNGSHSKVQGKDAILLSIAYVRDFLQLAIPAHIFFTGRNALFRTIQSLISKHDYTTMMWRPSLRNSRTARWLSLVRWVLISLFVNTLFFGICYPSDATCEGMVTKVMCLAEPSKVEAGRSLCIWDKTGSPQCTLRPPPETVSFFIMSSLLVGIISIPLELIIGFVQDEFAAKRPVLEQIGLNTDYWLGATSALKAVEEIAAGEDTVSHLSPLGQLFRMGINKKEKSVLDEQRFASVSETEKRNRHFDISKRREIEYFGRMELRNLWSSEEEADYLIKTVQKVLGGDIESGTLSHALGEDANQLETRVNALVQHMHVYSDGTPAPLSAMQRLRFGNFRGRIIAKIENARDFSREIEKAIESYEGEPALKDLVLVQRFILEQFMGLKRIVLEELLMNCDELCSPEKVGAIPWILAWLFIDGALSFFVYWIFRWGVYNGGQTLTAWGTVYVVETSQDVFLLSTTRIVVIYFLTTESMMLQLKAIYACLNNAILDFMQEGEASVDQDFRIAQHFSGACRAARSEKAKDLPAAALLRKLDDVEMTKCRESRFAFLGWASRFLIMSTVGMILVFGAVGDKLVDTLISSFYSGVIVICSMIYEASLAGIAVFCIVLGGLAFYGWTPIRRRLNRIVDARMPDVSEGRNNILRVLFANRLRKFLRNNRKKLKISWMQLNFVSGLQGDTSMSFGGILPPAGGGGGGGGGGGSKELQNRPRVSISVSLQSISQKDKLQGMSLPSEIEAMKSFVEDDEEARTMKEKIERDFRHLFEAAESKPTIVPRRGSSPAVRAFKNRQTAAAAAEAVSERDLAVAADADDTYSGVVYQLLPSVTIADDIPAAAAAAAESIGGYEPAPYDDDDDDDDLSSVVLATEQDTNLNALAEYNTTAGMDDDIPAPIQSRNKPRDAAATATAAADDDDDGNAAADDGDDDASVASQLERQGTATMLVSNTADYVSRAAVESEFDTKSEPVLLLDGDDDDEDGNDNGNDDGNEDDIVSSVLSQLELAEEEGTHSNALLVESYVASAEYHATSLEMLPDTADTADDIPAPNRPCTELAPELDTTATSFETTTADDSEAVAQLLPDTADDSEAVAQLLPDTADDSEAVAQLLPDTADDSEAVAQLLPDTADANNAYSEAAAQLLPATADANDTGSEAVAQLLPDTADANTDSEAVAQLLPDTADANDTGSEAVAQLLPDTADANTDSEAVAQLLPDTADDSEAVAQLLPDTADDSEAVAQLIPDTADANNAYSEAAAQLLPDTAESVEGYEPVHDHYHTAYGDVDLSVEIAAEVDQDATNLNTLAGVNAAGDPDAIHDMPPVAPAGIQSYATAHEVAVEQYPNVSDPETSGAAENLILPNEEQQHQVPAAVQSEAHIDSPAHELSISRSHDSSVDNIDSLYESDREQQLVERTDSQSRHNSEEHSLDEYEDRERGATVLDDGDDGHGHDNETGEELVISMDDIYETREDL